MQIRFKEEETREAIIAAADLVESGAYIQLVYDNECCGSTGDLKALNSILETYRHTSKIKVELARLMDNGHGGIAVVFNTKLK